MNTTLDQLFITTKRWLLDRLALFLPDALIPWVSVVIKIGVLIVLAIVIMMYLTWLERKLVARIQNRFGPNRVGPFGLLQPIADAVKMLTKEDIVPLSADRLVHFLAPVVILVPALVIWCVLPFGRGMIAANLDLGVLFFLALSAMTTIAIFMGGWASHNKFSLLGAMRAVAQLVSYEVPMVLSVATAVMAAGSFSTEEIVQAQSGWNGFRWFVFTPWGFAAFIIFFVASVAEVNRTPFDLPEAESEIVAGFHTEFSGMKFALFFMAEYINLFALCALGTTLFLGGWQGPGLPSWAWFFGKTFTLISIVMWLRGTFPRLRIDQLLGLAWKGMLPLALVNIGAAGLWYFLPSPKNVIASAGVLAATVLFLIGFQLNELPKKRTYELVE